MDHSERALNFPNTFSIIIRTLSSTPSVPVQTPALPVSSAVTGRGGGGEQDGGGGGGRHGQQGGQQARHRSICRRRRAHVGWNLAGDVARVWVWRDGSRGLLRCDGLLAHAGQDVGGQGQWRVACCGHGQRRRGGAMRWRIRMSHAGDGMEAWRNRSMQWQSEGGWVCQVCGHSTWAGSKCQLLLHRHTPTICCSTRRTEWAMSFV